jgi:hypothetical protein
MSSTKRIASGHPQGRLYAPGAGDTTTCVLTASGISFNDQSLVT